MKIIIAKVEIEASKKTAIEVLSEMLPALAMPVSVHEVIGQVREFKIPESNGLITITEDDENIIFDIDTELTVDMIEMYGKITKEFIPMISTGMAFFQTITRLFAGFGEKVESIVDAVGKKLKAHGYKDEYVFRNDLSFLPNATIEIEVKSSIVAKGSERYVLQMVLDMDSIEMRNWAKQSLAESKVRIIASELVCTSDKMKMLEVIDAAMAELA